MTDWLIDGTMADKHLNDTESFTCRAVLLDDTKNTVGRRFPSSVLAKIATSQNKIYIYSGNDRSTSELMGEVISKGLCTTKNNVLELWVTCKFNIHALTKAGVSVETLGEFAPSATGVGDIKDFENASVVQDNYELKYMTICPKHDASFECARFMS